MSHDRQTLTLYAGLGVLGFVLNGMGAILSPLQRDLSLDKSQVAFYPSLFAVALIAVGIVGGPLVAALGHRISLLASVAGIGVGAVLLAAPDRAVTLLGAGLLGCGGALMAQTVPAALSRRHGAGATAAVGEANAVSIWASVLAPVTVAAALLVGANWRLGYLVPIIPAVLVMASCLRRPTAWGAGAPSGRPETDSPVADVPRPPMFGRWVDVLLSVSIEFCMVLWSATAFAEWHGAGPVAAPVLAAGFLVGMALVRTAAAPITLNRTRRQLVLTSCAVAGGGTLTFWLVPSMPLAALGVLVAGMGVGLLYPATITALLSTRPDMPDTAAARAALASGLAIGVAPLVLARLADWAGLRAAYAVVPLLVAVLGTRAARREK